MFFKKRRRRYFISAMVTRCGEKSIGQFEVELNRPIKGIEDIREVADLINNGENLDNTIVINWRLFE